MKLLLSILLILIFVNSNIIPHPGKPKSHAPRVYNVQIRDPPEKRWAQMIYDYRHALHTFMSEF